MPPDSPWVTPRLYDEETETLTPDAFKLFGGALVDEAKEQNLPLALVIVDLAAEARVGDGAHLRRPDPPVRALADVLRRSLRSGDIVGRHREHSFALLLHTATAARATHVARWIQTVVGQWPIGSGGGMTILAQGIAELTAGEGDLAALVDHAEEALTLAAEDRSGSIRVYAAEVRTLATRNVAVAPLERPVPARLPARKRRRQARRTTGEIPAASEHQPAVGQSAVVPAAKRGARGRRRSMAEPASAQVVEVGHGPANDITLRVDIAIRGLGRDHSIRRS